MKVTQLSVVAVAAIAALGIVSGTANAAPVDGGANDGTTISTDLLPGIHYTASIVDHSVVVTTDAGRLTTRDGQFEILGANGDLVAGVPLTYRMDQQDFPIAAQISGNTVTLTPSATPVAAQVHPVAQQYPSVDARNAAAFTTLVQQTTLAAALGAMIGTVVGGVTGCLLGATALTAATIPLAALLGAGPIAGCAAGAVLLGPVGTIAGAIVVGAPIVAVSAFQYFSAVNAPFAPAPAPK
ncbi:hypothetical protein [Antrihabitans cavernicola]|uniref:DUF8020 domain-containing protein n=1 Tax=Antrihabitans cavernicola TaxID=2495913 RepID=A0A5A7SBM9_9NOCA|nr:hypothetical protein [Spelaeibacter cavernicola]KAA0022247.1 hypothetical protein FOY51_14775 [Spelaeibacter cavernicola]